jgi:hypothetical protein
VRSSHEWQPIPIRSSSISNRHPTIVPRDDFRPDQKVKLNRCHRFIHISLASFRVCAINYRAVNLYAEKLEAKW